MIVSPSTEQLYFEYSNEDLKVEYDGVGLCINSPASYKHEKAFLRIITLLKSFFDRNPTLGDVIGSRFALQLPSGKRPEPDIVILPSGSAQEETQYSRASRSWSSKFCRLRQGITISQEKENGTWKQRSLKYCTLI